MLKVCTKKGQRFGRLTFVEEAESICYEKSRARVGVFKCDCGKVKKIRIYDVIGGKVNSCKCLHNELLSEISSTHRMSKTKIYRVWASMVERCRRKECKSYPNYGGRGIKVSKSWLKFENFYNDMGERPNEKMTIERINNEGNYCKANCKWATIKEQQNNKRTSLVYRGENATDAGFRLGGSNSIITQRIQKLGWSKHKAFTTPKLKNYK